AKIGFDGFGYGGWPITEDGGFDLESAKTIAQNSPENYFLYGLGVGKPDDLVACAGLGYNIFDCVLPTRDARHGRLYVYDAESIDEINIMKPKFYSFYNPEKQKYFSDKTPVSAACDCLLCRKYSKAYLSHLFRIGDFEYGRGSKPGSTNSRSPSRNRFPSLKRSFFSYSR
ncbi:MAG: tRNA-guanine transglycosylase, partial [Candidatus Woesebacteria bacterium]|nr:tRNA-guanine transglycosylase [Candidatus Woesebacteria bacterium]